MISFIIASVIAFIGLFVRGLTGFGSALIMTPLLLFFFDIKIAVVATAIIEIAAGLLVTLQARKSLDRPSLLIVLPISIVGIVAGAFILVSFESDLLKRLFGGFTIIFALRILINLFKNVSAKKSWSPGFGYFAGILGGIFGGLFGTAGPPIAIYLENQLKSKDTLRATMLFYFLMIDSIRLIPYTYSKLMTFDVLKICFFMLPTSLIGASLGKIVHLKINEKGFRAAISILLICTGVILVFGK